MYSRNRRSLNYLGLFGLGIIAYLLLNPFHLAILLDILSGVIGMVILGVGAIFFARLL